MVPGGRWVRSDQWRPYLIIDCPGDLFAKAKIIVEIDKARDVFIRICFQTHRFSEDISVISAMKGPWQGNAFGIGFDAKDL